MPLRALILCLSLSATVGCDYLFPGMPDYSGMPDIAIPDISGLDIPDVPSLEDSGEVSCARNCYDRVCGPDDCGGTCGTCPSGTVCSLDYSVCLPEQALRPDGSSCGQTASCTPTLPDPFVPGSVYENPDWPGCLDHQCQGLVCDQGMCSRPCVVRKDSSVNGTSIASRDYIEDSTAGTDCVVAAGSAYEGDMMCVGRRKSWEGDLIGVCRPASSFTPCNPSDNCPGTEECSYVLLPHGLERRCVTPITGGGFAQECGFDPFLGDTVLCESGLCSEAGCTRPCDRDDQCLVPGYQCVSGVCAGGLKTCSGDTECSPWVCGSSVDIMGIAASACEPRRCSGDFDCPGEGYYCATAIEQDITGALVASGRCAPAVVGGADVGEPCGTQPGGGVIPCRNRDMCVDGYCSARCQTDFDCFIHGDLRCALKQESTVIGYVAGQDVWFDVGYCIPTGYRPEGCRNDSSCDGRVCTPWVSDAWGRREVLTTCMDPPANGWPLGTACGRYAWDAVCQARYCFGQDDVYGLPGWCSSTCVVDSDCPSTTPLGVDEARWICAAMPIIGAESLPLEDDLFASWCVPVSVESSLADCSATRYCADQGQVCSPVLRAGPGVENERVDYLCLAASDGRDPGYICDPAGDGSDCAGGICSPSAMTGIGFCSVTCLSDSQCLDFGENVACRGMHMGFSTQGQPLFADVCRMTGECIVCESDADCGAGHRCANVSGSLWWADTRCVRECDVSADCADIAGRSCEDVSSGFTTSGIQIKACMTPVCS